MGLVCLAWQRRLFINQKAGIHPPSFRRRPESSGLSYIPAPAGMTTDTTTQRAVQQNLPSIYHRVPALLGGLFQTPLYHLHPCRRGFQLSLE